MNELNAANAMVWYYGNLDPGKEITINYQKVTEFTEATISDPDQKYAYHAIVIFDFDGKMNVKDEELKLVKQYCEEQHYDLLYYGSKHLESFQKVGFFQVMSDDTYGFTYNGSYWVNREVSKEYLNPYLLMGNWTEDDNKRYNTDDSHLMWKFLISYIEGLISDQHTE